MKDSYSVLLVGASTVSYSESGPSLSMTGLLEAELARLLPAATWRCSSGILYVRPGMAERAVAMVERDRPDIVVLRPSSTAFLSDLVVYRVRERWPAFYRTAVNVSGLLNALSGGDRRGGSSRRGLLFRVPRGIAARLIGVAPDVSPEAAAACLIETLDALLQLEDTEVILHISTDVSRGLPPEEHARRAQIFRDAVADYCRRRRVPLLDPERSSGASAQGWVYAQDRWHPTLEYRSVDASLIAAQVAQVVTGALPSS